MPKKSHIINTPLETLAEPIAKPIWDSACAYHRAQAEYDRLTRELDRTARILRASGENLSSALKNHGVGSVVIDMNATDRIVAIYGQTPGQHDFLLLNKLSNEAIVDNLNANG